MSDPADAKTIFLAALDRAPEERERYLESACGGDVELRRRVADLLAADARETRFPGVRALSAVTLHEDAEEIPGHQIGRYRLVERIGEGGFGSVWRAEQLEPVRRDVALKLVKRGMDSRAIVARFALEQRALAVMDHPNIATIFDGGETRTGRPFFAMELVAGRPVTAYCDEHRLDPEARLRLFLPICRALQHAHQKGVVHRDIKPSNVLVARLDGVATPKVIDFGIAKALHEPPAELSLRTGLRQMVGTPDYMSPEQAGASTIDIDTRSDVYSLGVLLYELLTGTVPFATRGLAGSGLVGVLQAIREQDPPRPSSRVVKAGDAGALVAQQRGCDARRLARRLRGDLDCIVMKALEKDRDLRYATAVELAADLERHLAHEPVLASPPSVVYRLRKLMRRYRGRFVAAAALLLTIVVGSVATTWFALAARSNAEQAVASRLEFDQLSAAVLLDRVVAAAAVVSEQPPDQEGPLRTWDSQCNALLARRPGIEQTVAELRSRALPAEPEELAADRRRHPRRIEWEALTADVAAERRAREVREGAAATEVPLPPEFAGLPALQLGQLAWERLPFDPRARRVHGEEAVALAMVRAALAQPPSPLAPRYWLLSALSLALVQAGRDDEAIATMEQSVALAPEDRKAGCEVALRGLIEYVEAGLGDAGRERLRARERQLAELTDEVNARTTFRFADQARQFLHDTLSDVLAGLDRLQAGPRRHLQRRLLWATRVDSLTMSHPRARSTWAEAAAAVAAADGPYRGANIDLRPQTGLVPIGANPRTGLWEFYDLRSAWDGVADPSTIEIPTHDAEGRIAVAEETGIVFVLLPGGTVTIGAQGADPTGPNFDPAALTTMGPVRTVALAPFFLARHEMTQGQWQRLWLGDAAMEQPSRYRAGLDITIGVDLAESRVTDAHPVEHVDWHVCDRLLRQHAMQLPSVAQWEYACRAGTGTPWTCPESELVHHANLADATGLAVNAEWPAFMPWNDRCLLHATVGRFVANTFGLHDMHGNVCEWCSDGFSEFTDANGRPIAGDTCRAIRGGGFTASAAQARSAFHRWPAPALRSPDLGLRAARGVDR